MLQRVSLLHRSGFLAFLSLTQQTLCAEEVVDALSPGGCEISFIAPRAPSGTLIVHAQDTWHGSGPNVSERPRRTVVAHLVRSDVRFVQSPDYIYGRYKLRGSDAVHEDFFPVISGPDRSEWLDDYCAPTFAAPYAGDLSSETRS